MPRSQLALRAADHFELSALVLCISFRCFPDSKQHFEQAVRMAEGAEMMRSLSAAGATTAGKGRG